jgi:hypothetical protein
MLDLPLLASPALGRPRSWSAPPAATRPSPQQGCAVSRAAARVGVVDPPRARWSGPQTPHVATRSSSRHPEPSRESQDPLPRTPTKGCGSPSPRRLPPASPTVDARARARTATAWAATGAPALPPKAQLPTCFHAPTRGALDPRAYRLFAGAPRPHAACQLLQWSVPRARQRAVRSPALAVASHVPPGDGAPCGASSAGLSQVRGHLALRTASTPTTTTARRSGFTPT